MSLAPITQKGSRLSKVSKPLGMRFEGRIYFSETKAPIILGLLSLLSLLFILFFIIATILAILIAIPLALGMTIFILSYYWRWSHRKIRKRDKSVI